jgi:hypothetical protein
MPAPVRLVHNTDPKQEIIDDAAELLSGVKIPPYSVLLVMYERGVGKEKKTAGGIIVPQAQPTGTLREDTFQGKVGLVMKVGALAFTEDDTHHWDGFKPAEGDWVAISVGDTYSFDLPGPRRCRIVDDANVRMIVPDEVFDAIW